MRQPLAATGSAVFFVLAPGTVARSGAVVADRMACAPPVVAAAAGGRCGGPDRRGGRPGRGVRAVRDRGPWYARGGRAHRDAGGGRPVPVRPQPDVRGGGGRRPRAGAAARPGRAAGLCRRGVALRGGVRAVVRGACAGSPVRRAIRGVPPRGTCLAPPAASVDTRRGAAVTAPRPTWRRRDRAAPDVAPP